MGMKLDFSNLIGPSIGRSPGMCQEDSGLSGPDLQMGQMLPLLSFVMALRRAVLKGQLRARLRPAHTGGAPAPKGTRS